MFEALIIEDEAFNEVLAKNLGGPDAELGCLPAVNPVANGDDGVEVVEFQFAGDRPRPLRLNYPVFPDSCQFLQLGGGINVFEVLIDGSQVYPKEF